MVVNGLLLLRETRDAATVPAAAAPQPVWRGTGLPVNRAAQGALSRFEDS
ncbi:hypothetical protein J3A78_000147 [Streptomyces sp. PvR006]|nr:hypothetical protein [Streptomyces sp. PvR006]